MTADDPIALVVGASAEEFDRATQCLPSWQCVSAAVDTRQADVRSVPKDVQLNLVFARKDENETLIVCKKLRNMPKTSGAPILLVIGRYLISQGHAVRRMGNAGFIMTPFDEKEMRDKLADAFGLALSQGDRQRESRPPELVEHVERQDRGV